ncbi:IS66 family insertion sequence element accessory protein TnpB [Thiolapillus sp.]|uniref:IS66 family insertion sequence element accessory protein TnpB n=1 Tax=Thiolapillus sp. TaxID=2017437 RepID=UPI003AF95C8D
MYWEDNGFVLYYKSLAEEKFHWPGGEEELVSLTGQQTLPAMESEAKAGSPQ